MHFDWVAMFWLIYGVITVASFLIRVIARYTARQEPPYRTVEYSISALLWWISIPLYMWDDARNRWDYRPILSLKLTPDEGGYWLSNRKGNFPFGNALEYVFKDGVWGENKEDPGIYFAPDGRVFTHGEIQHYGDLAGRELQAPIITALLTRSRQGYWLVGADGSVFPFGDAQFHGSLGHAPADYNIDWKPTKGKVAATIVDAKPFLMQPAPKEAPVEALDYGSMSGG